MCFRNIEIKSFYAAINVVVFNVAADRPVMARTEITRPCHTRPSNVVKAWHFE